MEVEFKRTEDLRERDVVSGADGLRGAERDTSAAMSADDYRLFPSELNVRPIDLRFSSPPAFLYFHCSLLVSRMLPANIYNSLAIQYVQPK